MKVTPDVIGYKLESALNILSDYNFKTLIKETISNKETNHKEARVIKQIFYDNTLKLIISYF